VLSRGREGLGRGGGAADRKLWALSVRLQLKMNGYNKKRLEVRSLVTKHLTIPHRRHRVLITNTSRLKVLRQTISVYCKNYMENSLRGKDVVVICVVRLLLVLFYVLSVCKCVLPPGDNQIAVNTLRTGDADLRF